MKHGLTRKEKREINQKLWRESRTTIAAIGAPMGNMAPVRVRQVPMNQIGQLVPRKVKGLTPAQQAEWDREREAFMSRITKPILITPLPKPWPEGSVVYYVRVHNRIKIGTSDSVVHRLVDLQHACPYELELLATEPGGVTRERARHKQFAKHRVRGEWFFSHTDVLQHVVTLRPDLVAQKRGTRPVVA